VKLGLKLIKKQEQNTKKLQADQETNEEKNLARIQATADKIDELREEAKKPFDIIAKFVVDKQSLEKLDDLRRRLGEPFKIPVEIDLKGREALTDTSKLIKAIRARGFRRPADVEAAAKSFGLSLGEITERGGGFEGPGKAAAEAAATEFRQIFALSLTDFTPKFKPEVIPPTEAEIQRGITTETGQKFTVPVTPTISPDELIAEIKKKREEAEAKDPDAGKVELKLSFDEDGLARVGQIRADLAEVVEPEVDFVLNLLSEAAILQSKEKVGTKVTIPVGYSDIVDVPGPGGSPHPIADAASILRKTLTPPDIEVGAGIKPGNGIREAGGRRGPQGQAKTVRVEINMNGEQMDPINVSSDKDADNLVKAIKRTNRTRGNFRTPFTKNG